MDKSKRKSISSKTRGEFEPLKLLNISVEGSQSELNELEHVQINFRLIQKEKFDITPESLSDAILHRTETVCLCFSVLLSAIPLMLLMLKPTLSLQ